MCPNCLNHFWNYKMYFWCRYARTRAHGVKMRNFSFFNSGYTHDRNISIFRRRASRVTGNTLIKPSYPSVRQSRDSLHRGTHKVTKKSSETAWAMKLKKFAETCFLAQIWFKSIKNWRRYSRKTAIMAKLVIAMYRLRPIQSRTGYERKSVRHS